MNIQARLLRMPQVSSICGLKKSAIYKRIKEGTFPAPVALGSKHVAWRSDQVEKWILTRPIVTDLPEEDVLEDDEVAK